MTRAEKNNISPIYEENSLISIFKKCDFKTYWIGNQNPGDTYFPYVTNCDSIIINKSYQTTYSFAKKLDEELIPYVDNLLKEERSLKLFVIHLIGSHWFYNSHYPESFEKFKPVMKGKTISPDDSMKIVNSYDNTILYTDYILSQFINRIKEQRSLMLYISDHGEMLGEGNKWLHAHESEYEKNPAFILWFSPKYEASNNKLSMTAFQNKDKRYETGTVFHSLLQASFISSEYLDTTLSVFY